MTREEIIKLCNTADWKWGTSEGAELHTLLLGLTTTFREKVEWLEEAENLVLALRAGREKAQRSKEMGESENQAGS